MEKDKRSLYVWAITVFANIAVILWTISYNNPQWLEIKYTIVFGYFFLLTVIPVLISKSRYKYKDKIGYGIPCIFSLLTLYFIYDYFTCTGKFCDLGAAIFGIITFTSAAISLLFYAISVNIKVFNLRILFSIICIEVLVIIYCVLQLASVI